MHEREVNTYALIFDYLRLCCKSEANASDLQHSLAIRIFVIFILPSNDKFMFKF